MLTYPQKPGFLGPNKRTLITLRALCVFVVHIFRIISNTTRSRFTQPAFNPLV
jgi:hypothetical protein